MEVEFTVRNDNSFGNLQEKNSSYRHALKSASSSNSSSELSIPDVKFFLLVISELLYILVSYGTITGTLFLFLKRSFDSTIF